MLHMSDMGFACHLSIWKSISTPLSPMIRPYPSLSPTGTISILSLPQIGHLANLGPLKRDTDHRQLLQIAKSLYSPWSDNSILYW
jgi:hypothetical protein